VLFYIFNYCRFVEYSDFAFYCSVELVVHKWENSSGVTHHKTHSIVTNRVIFADDPKKWV